MANVLNIYYANTVVSEQGNNVGGYAFLPWDNNPGPSEQYIIINTNNHDNQSTLAHELGHFFGLVHTHETYYGIEYVNQSNCSTAGDRVCDTPADPGLSGCLSSSCQYLAWGSCPQTDPLGGVYNPSTSNIMSYASSSCRTTLTSGQKSRMYSYYPDRSYLQCSSSGSGGGNSPCSALPLSTDCTAPTSGDVSGATYSGVPIPTCSGYTSSQALDRWYEFTALSNSAILTLGCSQYFDGVLALYSGNCSNPNYIDCIDNGGGPGGGELLVVPNLTVGQTYLVRIYEYGTPGSTFTFQTCVTFPSSGTADLAIDRLEIDGPSTIYVGDEVDLEAYTTNVGSSPVTTPIQIEYFIDNNSVGTDPINNGDLPLAPGDVDFEDERNYEFLTAGTHQYCVTIANHAQETNYSNNTSCIQVTVLDPLYQISLSSSPSNGGSVSGGGPYSSGAPVQAMASPNSGWVFDHWSENGSQVSTQPNYSFNATADRTLVAHFSQVSNSFTVTTASNPVSGGTTSGGGNFSGSSQATVTASPATGWSFDGWTENGNLVYSQTSYPFLVNSNRNLVAQFSQTSTLFVVSTTATPQNSGTVTGAGSYSAGDSVHLTASPFSGWSFQQWEENGTIIGTNPTLSFSIYANRNITAVFSGGNSTCALAIVANPSNGGFVLGAGNYLCGLNANLTAVPSSGWQLFNWMEGNTIISTQASFGYLINSNANLVANFIPAVGVHESRGLEEQLMLSPNPSTGNIGLLHRSSKGDVFDILVFDLQGKVVFEEKQVKLSSQQPFHIDLSKQAKGLYVVRCLNAQKSWHHKVVLQ